MAETPQPRHSLTEPNLTDPNLESEDSPAGETAAGDETLPELHRGILDFEKKTYKYGGAKEDAIRANFGLTATQYYQILNGLIDQPVARRYAPYVVERLQQQRAARTAAAGNARATSMEG